MTYLSQEQAVKLADQAEIDAVKKLGCEGEYHPDYWKVEAQLLCNAAIAHYLAEAPLLNGYVDKCIKDHMKRYFEQMGEGLPEPSMKYQHTFMGKHTDYFTREQMIAFGAKQREGR